MPVIEGIHVRHDRRVYGWRFRTLPDVERMPRAARTQGSLRVLGFPLSVRPGFWLFMLLLLLLYPFPLGAWIAGAVAVFTLVHELGHALAARASGCRARISLDFMVAYAAFESRRPLAWWQRAGIALAGPAAQMGLAVGVLAAMGVSPFSRDEIVSSHASAAIWWAGLALGLLNLLPLVPLDGGAIVASLIDAAAPGRGKAVMVRISFGITLFLVVVLLFTPARSIVPFLGLLAFVQWQQLTLGGMTPFQMMDALVAEWHREPSTAAAVEAARIAASLDLPGWTLAWLEAAERAQMSPGELAAAIGDARDLAPVIHDPAVSGFLTRVRPEPA